MGSPERPLSDLGLLCYRSYWKDKVLSYLTKHNSQSISMKGNECGGGIGEEKEYLLFSLTRNSLSVSPSSCRDKSRYWHQC